MTRVWRRVLLGVVFGATCLTSAGAAIGEGMTPLPSRVGLTVRGALAVPAAPEPAPIVLLHGICGEPRNSCAVLGEIARGDVVCARADMACPAGGSMWSGGGAAIARIEAAVEDAARVSGRFDPSGPRVMVGFSQGAYVAMRAMRTQPGRYPAALLIGAFVKPTRRELESLGLKRLALVAGDYDGAAPTMRASAAQLAAEGFDARYFSLGKVPHTYVGDDPQKLRDALTWTEAAVDDVTRGPAPGSDRSAHAAR